MTLKEKFDTLDTFISKRDLAYRLEFDYFGFFLEVRQLDQELSIWTTVKCFNDIEIDSLLSQVIDYLEESEENVVYLADFK